MKPPLFDILIDDAPDESIDKFKDLYLKVGFLPIKLNWKPEFAVQKEKESTLLLDAKGILTGEVVIEKFIWNKIAG